MSEGCCAGRWTHTGPGITLTFLFVFIVTLDVTFVELSFLPCQIGIVVQTSYGCCGGFNEINYTCVGSFSRTMYSSNLFYYLALNGKRSYNWFKILGWGANSRGLQKICGKTDIKHNFSFLASVQKVQDILVTSTISI